MTEPPRCCLCAPDGPEVERSPDPRDAEIELMRAAVMEIRRIADQQAPIYIADRRAILAACERVLGGRR